MTCNLKNNKTLFVEQPLKINLMTSIKVINAEQKNKHKFMTDVNM